jgi:hypothetical protein
MLLSPLARGWVRGVMQETVFGLDPLTWPLPRGERKMRKVAA